MVLSFSRARKKKGSRRKRFTRRREHLFTAKHTGLLSKTLLEVVFYSLCSLDFCFLGFRVFLKIFHFTLRVVHMKKIDPQKNEKEKKVPKRCLGFKKESFIESSSSSSSSFHHFIINAETLKTVVFRGRGRRSCFEKKKKKKKKKKNIIALASTALCSLLSFSQIVVTQKSSYGRWVRAQNSV